MNTAANITSKPEISLKSEVSKKSSLADFIKNYILLPGRAGFYGFTIIFTLLIITDLLSFKKSFKVDMNDILLSSLGFVCLFLIYLLKNSKKN